MRNPLDQRIGLTVAGVTAAVAAPNVGNIALASPDRADAPVQERVHSDPLLSFEAGRMTVSHESLTPFMNNHNLLNSEPKATSAAEIGEFDQTRMDSIQKRCKVPAMLVPGKKRSAWEPSRAHPYIRANLTTDKDGLTTFRMRLFNRARYCATVILNVDGSVSFQNPNFVSKTVAVLKEDEPDSIGQVVFFANGPESFSKKSDKSKSNKATK